MALVVAAFLLAEFLSFPQIGHRVDTTKWPAEAQAVLTEKPGTPITSEQWKRIDRLLQEHGDTNFGQRPYWAQTVRASWWWFLLAPLLGIAIIRFRGQQVSPLCVSMLAGPSVAALVVGIALSGSGA